MNLHRWLITTPVINDQVKGEADESVTQRVFNQYYIELQNMGLTKQQIFSRRSLLLTPQRILSFVHTQTPEDCTSALQAGIEKRL